MLIISLGINQNLMSAYVPRKNFYPSGYLQKSGLSFQKTLFFFSLQNLLFGNTHEPKLKTFQVGFTKSSILGYS